ncbi:MAG: hypothetical protein FWC76_08325 [Defluviitaleaceae bacterium]|nr:hypothetical protein [Defluviitaleaceae bacterium]
MKKRLFAILIVSIGLAIFASCDTAPEATPEVHITPTRGFWEDNTFVSPYFGVRFDLPDGWNARSDDEIVAMFADADLEYAQIPQGGEVTPDAYEALEASGLIDMTAGGDRGTRGITLRLGRLSDDEIGMTALQFLENMVEEMDLPDTTDVTIFTDTTTIGAQDWYFAMFSYPFRHENVYNLYFVNVDGRFVRSVIISHFGSIGSPYDTLEYFRPY